MSFTPDEEDLLKLLLKHVAVTVYHDVKFAQDVTELRLKNVAMWSDVKGATAVVVIDASKTNGVQRPIATRGAKKCAICDEWMTEQVMVCENCINAVKWARSKEVAPTRETLELLKKVNDAGLLDALIYMNKENIAKWMENETEGMK